MAKNDKLKREEQREVDTNVDEDFHEAAEFEFANLLAAAGGESGPRRKSGLIAKLEADPAGRFKVSEFSMYCEDTWLLARKPNCPDRRVNFKSSLSGGNVLKRMLTYHLLPQFNPYGRLNSYTSTATYAWGFGSIEEYLFVANGLEATPKCIRVMSAQTLNAALDNIKARGSRRSYVLMYVVLRLWLALSAEHLIPQGYRLSVELGRVDSTERRRDIQEAIATTAVGWRPYSDDELSVLIEYAHFWTVHAIPALFDIWTYMTRNGLTEQAHQTILRSSRVEELEHVLSTKIDDTVICGYSISHQRTRSRAADGSLLMYTYCRYRWWRQFMVAIDKVRTGILIWVSLLSAMRISELGPLTFDSVRKNMNAQWSIKVTRFKTSNDPNYKGEVDWLPLPALVGNLIADYRRLRSLDARFWRQGLLFEQVTNSRTSNVLTRTIDKALRALGRELFVDNIHAHRFRKTIAEILIHRSERNIDLIRHLFGHRSYVMSLRYIARNPYLVGAIVETMAVHFASDFLHIVAAVRDGRYSGAAADRIAKIAAVRPSAFRGQILQIRIFDYVIHLLRAGEPLVIERTGIGTYCCSNTQYRRDSPPPCLENRIPSDGLLRPDPANCQLDCNCAVVLQEAIPALEQNIDFYTGLLDQTKTKLSRKNEKMLLRKLEASETHLATLKSKRAPAANVAESRKLS